MVEDEVFDILSEILNDISINQTIKTRIEARLQILDEIQRGETDDPISIHFENNELRQQLEQLEAELLELYNVKEKIIRDLNISL